MKITERIESVKAGLFGALGGFMSSLLFYCVNYLIYIKHSALFPLLSVSSDNELAFKLIIAIISGLLFGICYRYIVRDRDNPHLQDGVVLAFGLVRGLAKLERTNVFNENLPSSIVFLGESILIFAIARLIIDFAYKRNLI